MDTEKPRLTGDNHDCRTPISVLSNNNCASPNSGLISGNKHNKSKLILPTTLWIILITLGICFLALLSSLNVTLKSLDEVLSLERQAALNSRRAADLTKKVEFATKRSSDKKQQHEQTNDNEPSSIVNAFVDEININFGDSQGQGDQKHAKKDKRRAKKIESSTSKQNDVDQDSIVFLEIPDFNAKTNDKHSIRKSNALYKNDIDELSSLFTLISPYDQSVPEITAVIEPTGNDATEHALADEMAANLIINSMLDDAMMKSAVSSSPEPPSPVAHRPSSKQSSKPMRDDEKQLLNRLFSSMSPFGDDPEMLISKSTQQQQPETQMLTFIVDDSTPMSDKSSPMISEKSSKNSPPVAPATNLFDLMFGPQMSNVISPSNDNQLFTMAIEREPTSSKTVQMSPLESLLGLPSLTADDVKQQQQQTNGNEQSLHMIWPSNMDDVILTSMVSQPDVGQKESEIKKSVEQKPQQQQNAIEKQQVNANQPKINEQQKSDVAASVITSVITDNKNNNNSNNNNKIVSEIQQNIQSDAIPWTADDQVSITGDLLDMSSLLGGSIVDHLGKK